MIPSLPDCETGKTAPASPGAISEVVFLVSPRVNVTDKRADHSLPKLYRDATLLPSDLLPTVSKSHSNSIKFGASTRPCCRCNLR